ncbi:MAG: hypothetical protein ACP5E5_11625 [Acidobacteriaceae bacterium]
MAAGAGGAAGGGDLMLIREMREDGAEGGAAAERMRAGVRWDGALRAMGGGFFNRRSEEVSTSVDGAVRGEGGLRVEAGRRGVRARLRRAGCTENADLRNTGEGGWCYTEHELFRVFLPLIGADGGMVYMAMTRLVPLAAVREELAVTVEAVSRESCVSRSTTHRKMRELVQLGMVLEIKGANRRPSAYQLPPLRELAKVGEEELRRRLEELRGERVSKAPAGARVPLRQEGEDRAGAVSEAGRLGASVETVGAQGVAAIPGWDRDGGEALAGTPVSQRRAAMSQERGAVSQQKIAFNCFKEEQEREEKKIPPTPHGGRLTRDGSVGRVGGWAAQGAEGAASGLASGLAAGFAAGLASTAMNASAPAAALVAAARWVMEQSGVSASRRMESILVSQLRLALERRRAERLEEGSEAVSEGGRGCEGDGWRQGAGREVVEVSGLQRLASRMVGSWETYLGMCRRQELRIQWGFARFFGEGLWAEPAAWPRVTETRPTPGQCGAGSGFGVGAGSRSGGWSGFGGGAERDREPGILRRSTGRVAPRVDLHGGLGAGWEERDGETRRVGREGADGVGAAGMNEGEVIEAEGLEAGAAGAEGLEAEVRRAALDYWRRMRERGVAIYAEEAPHWVRYILEAEPLGVAEGQ